MINEQRLIENFISYIKIDSETKNEKEMCDHISKLLTDMKIEVIKDDIGAKIESNGYNIHFKYAKNTTENPILLSAHLDTVTPGININPIIDGDIIKSDGTTILGGDDKAGVAIILETIQTIIENDLDTRPIEVIFSIYEEGGLKGAIEFDYSQINAKEGIVLDSGGPIGTIIVKAPAQDVIDVDIYGKAAHAGLEPEKGVSAIQIAAHALENMNLYRIDEETTANFGTIHGGKATNIITDHVHLEGETRSLDVAKLEKQTQSMKDAFLKAAELYNGTIEFKVERNYNPYVISPEEPFIAKLAQAFTLNGYNPIYTSTGGGSDTNIYFSKGINCINISCGMSAVHTTKEFIKKSDMIGTANTLLTFLTK